MKQINYKINKFHVEIIIPNEKIPLQKLLIFHSNKQIMNKIFNISEHEK